MDLAELRARRLIAQRLSPTAALKPLTTPLAAAGWMTATQGQTYRAGIRALGLRSGVDDETVLAAVERHEIVRCWPQRGTLHFVTAPDARWLMRLGSPRVEAAAANRRPGLGLSPDDVVRARAALHDGLLAADAPVTRSGCYAIFAAAGIDPRQSRGPHLLRAFGGDGDVVQGPRQGREETFLHVAQLPLESRRPAEPAVESARRYVLSHGPATVRDYAWWSGLTMAESTEALVKASMLDDVIEHDGFWMGAWQEAVTDPELAAALEVELHLPAFDEFLLGYHDKSYALPDQLRPRVLTKNGISWDFVVRGGVVVGREGEVDG